MDCFVSEVCRQLAPPLAFLCCLKEVPMTRRPEKGVPMGWPKSKHFVGGDYGWEVNLLDT